MIGSNISKLRALQRVATFQLAHSITTPLKSTTRFRSPVFYRLNSSTANSTTTQAAEPEKIPKTAFKSSSNNEDFKSRIIKKYEEVENLLNNGKTAEAAQLFKEVYKPEQSYIFRQFSKNRSSHLPVVLFRKLLNEHLAGRSENIIPLDEFFSLYTQGQLAYGWMCANVILINVKNGKLDNAIETWVSFMESNRSMDVSNMVQNKEAAQAALVAYAAKCLQEGTVADSKIASYLVPIKSFPRKHEVINLLRTSRLGFQEEFIQSVSQSIYNVGLELLNPAGIDFLNDLPTDNPTLLGNIYSDCKKSSESNSKPLVESTYARFIFCFAESGRPTQAFDIWNDLLASGIVPSVQTWNMLLKAASLMKDSNIALTEGVLSKMQEQGVLPNSDSYAILMDVYFKQKLPDTALDIFEKIQNGEIKVSTNLKIFNIVVNGLLNNGRADVAKELLLEGIEKGFSPDIIAFNTFITYYIKKKEYDQVYTILSLMESTGVQPDVATYGYIIDVLYKTANSKGINPDSEVDGILEEMSKQGIRPTVTIMTSIIDGLGKLGNNIAASEIFQTMLRKRLRPNISTFTALINGEFIAGNVTQAAKYFKDIGDYNIVPPISSYNQMIQGFGRRSLLEESYDYFKRAEKAKSPLNNYTYFFILQAIYNSKRWDYATEVLNVLVKESETFKIGRQLQELLLKLEARNVKLPTFKFKTFDNLTPEKIEKVQQRA